MTREAGRRGGWLVVLALGLAGCTSSQISNMSPRVVQRSTNNLYRVEARWDSNQQALRPESLTPYVVIDRAFYPMQRTALTTNRWETLVPVPAGQRFLRFRFKFDYLYNGFGRHQADSRMSPDYQIELVE
jgi:hypothetical protein